MGTREQKRIFTIAGVFKTFGNNVDGNHYHQAYTQYKTLCDHARYLAKKDIETHDNLKSYYEENEENYPGCLSDDQKQTCLPLYDFLCSAGAVLDLTNVWPTYVFLVEVFNRQNKATIKTKPHIDKSEEFIPDVLQCMRSAMNVETWNAAHAEYKNLLKDEEQMKQIPDRAREKELWALSGDVAAQKFLDNIEYMDNALYLLIKEAMMKNINGSQTAWCQYGSLLHSSELLKREEEQTARRFEREIADLRDKCKELARQNEMKSRKIEELTERLEGTTLFKEPSENSVCTTNLTPASDVEENFSKLYDEEWTELFISLESEVEDERERIIKLLECVKKAFQFCKEESGKQLNKLHTITTEILSFCSTPKEENEDCHAEEQNSSSFNDLSFPLLEIKKQCLLMSLSKIRLMFEKSYVMMETDNEAIQRNIEAYIAGCINVCWSMCIQDPPMTILTTEKGNSIDTDMFNLYKTEGGIVDLCVWPALLRCEKADVVCKGCVLPQVI